MRLRETVRENGLIGLLFVPLCILLGHDFNVGRRCVRCLEPKRKCDY